MWIDHVSSPEVEPSNKPKRVYRHFPIGTNVALINDDKYTARVQRRLRRDLSVIFDFAHDWRVWIIRHPEYLPEPLKDAPRSILNNPRLDRLLRLCIVKISEQVKFSPEQRGNLVLMITEIYTQDGQTITEEVRKSINQLFIGKVDE